MLNVGSRIEVPLDIDRVLAIRMVEANLDVCLNRLEYLNLGIAACHVDHALALLREERDRVAPKSG
jgi:hypothetical protein